MSSVEKRQNADINKTMLTFKNRSVDAWNLGTKERVTGKGLKQQNLKEVGQIQKLVLIMRDSAAYSRFQNIHSNAVRHSGQTTVQ